jgi:hypothetical protein
MSSPTYRKIEEVKLEVVDRTLARQQISQFRQMAGERKADVYSDGVNDRILIGYGEGLFE